MVVFCDFETWERGNFDLETWEYVLLLVGSWNAWFYVLNFLKISNYFWIMQIPNPKRPVCIDLPQLMTLNFLPALQIAYLPSTLIVVLLDNVLVIWTHVCHCQYTSIEEKNASMETGLLNGIRSLPLNSLIPFILVNSFYHLKYQTDGTFLDLIILFNKNKLDSVLLKNFIPRYYDIYTKNGRKRTCI